MWLSETHKQQLLTPETHMHARLHQPSAARVPKTSKPQAKFPSITCWVYLLGFEAWDFRALSPAQP